MSFKIRAGRTLGLVGESGCGKTTVGHTITRLYKPIAENVIFDGTDLSHLCYRAPAEVRQKLQIIFQDPSESLNTRHTVREIEEEPFGIHPIGTAKKWEEEILQQLNRAGSDNDPFIRSPLEFSGGHRRRKCIHLLESG